MSNVSGGLAKLPMNLDFFFQNENMGVIFQHEISQSIKKYNSILYVRVTDTSSLKPLKADNEPNINTIRIIEYQSLIINLH